MPLSQALYQKTIPSGKGLAQSLSKALNKPMMTAKIHKTAPAPVQDHSHLLQAVGQRQDRDAFVEIFKYFAPRVKSYLLKNGANDSTAEEIVQNTFVTVWEKAKQFDPAKAAASTWIFTIARNKRIDILRREKFIEPETDDNPIENIAAPENETYAEHETVDRLKHAIDTLPDDQARLLKMAFFEDKSHQIISNETRLPLGTVKSRLRLALGKLRQIMTRGKEA